MSIPKKRLLMGIFTGGVGVVLKTAINIVLIPVLIHLLGVESYSVYVLIIGMLELALLMDLGFYRSIVTLMGQSTSRSAQETEAILSTGHWVYIILSLLVALLGLVLLPWFSQVFHIPQALRPTTELCLYIMLAEIVLSIYSFYYRSVMYAHSQHQWVNTAESLFVIASSVSGLCLLLAGYGLVWLFIARLFAAVIRTIWTIVFTAKMEPGVLVLSAFIDKGAFKSLAQLGVHSAIINLSVQISHNIDTYVIAAFLPLRSVAIYEIVFRFLSVTQQIALKMNEGIFPLFARLTAENDSQTARHLFLRMSSFLSYTVMTLLALIVCFYPELFRMISDQAIPVEETIPILLAAMPIVWSGSMQMPATSYLFSSGRQAYLSLSSLATALGNLILSLSLVQVLGTLGVVLGTLIPQLLQHQTGLIYTTCKDLAISLKEYLWRVHCIVLPGLVVMVAWVLGWKSLFNWTVGYPLLPMAAISLSGLFISAVVWLMLWTTPAERDKFLSLIKARGAATQGNSP